MERQTTAFGAVARKKMEFAVAQQELEKAEKKYKKEDDIVRNLEFLQENLEQASNNVRTRPTTRFPAFSFLQPVFLPVSTNCFSLGSKLPDILNVMSKQQQKKISQNISVKLEKMFD